MEQYYVNVVSTLQSTDQIRASRLLTIHFRPVSQGRDRAGPPQSAGDSEQRMKVVGGVVLTLSSILISCSQSDLMQVLMSAISNTLNDQPRLDPSTLLSAAASQLVGEEEEEIKNNVGNYFLYNFT